MIRYISSLLSFVFFLCFLVWKSDQDLLECGEVSVEDFSKDVPSLAQDVLDNTSPTSFSESDVFKNLPKTNKNVVGIRVKSGDSFSSLLRRFHSSGQQVELILQQLKKCWDVKSLRVGQVIWIEHQDQELQKIHFQPDPTFYFRISKDPCGKYQVEKITRPLFKKLYRAEGRINSSLYQALLSQKVPLRTVLEVVNALKYVLDFQNGLKLNDPFEILYHVYEDEEGNVVKNAEVAYISLFAQGRLIQLYRFDTPQGSPCYFTSKGESIVRGFLTTPIDPSKMRVSSRFQKARWHPIKGCYRDHKGVDFSAPKGTAVMAAGDGVIVKAGYSGAYGNMVRIRHAGGKYETVYAHLSRISTCVKPGCKVKQAQVIGAVGATGLATGPHLHYELLQDGKHHVDPLKVKQAPTVLLTGQDLHRFRQAKKTIDIQVVGRPIQTAMAAQRKIVS